MKTLYIYDYDNGDTFASNYFVGEYTDDVCLERAMAIEHLMKNEGDDEDTASEHLMNCYKVDKGTLQELYDSGIIITL